MQRQLALAAAISSMVLTACASAEHARGSIEQTVSGFFGSAQRPAAGATAPAPSTAPPPPEIISQSADLVGVVDGDTIRVDGKPIRLHGIDAPELDQTCLIQGAQTACGLIARNVVIGLISGAKVTCRKLDQDRFGRDVSRCDADGTDLSQTLVRTGWAIAYHQYSRDYMSDEEAAKSGRKGIWNGSFVPPWDWRRGVRE